MVMPIGYAAKGIRVGSRFIAYNSIVDPNDLLMLVKVDVFY